MTIGVVIATYNGEKYIEKQLESIITQTIKPTRIVISDACSADKTVSLCEDILSGQKVISYTIYKHDKQLNVTDNFNFGLNICNTDYVFMCDQDDVWLKDKIEVTLEAMIKYNACLGFTNARIVDSNLKSSSLSLWERIGFYCDSENMLFNPDTNALLTVLIRKNIVTGMCTCVSKELLAIALDIPNTTIHDVWLAMVASCVGNVVAIRKECVLYRQHTNNQIGTRRTFKKTINNMNAYKQKIASRIDTWQIFIDRYSDYMDQNIKYRLYEYEKFLLTRYSYLNGNKWKYKKRKELYKIYCDENNYKEVLVKDWIYRNIISKIMS